MSDQYPTDSAITIIDRLIAAARDRNRLELKLLQVCGIRTSEIEQDSGLLDIDGT